MPMASAPARDRSMILPGLNGPRSLMRTTTDRPLSRLVTVTSELNGSSLCAAVSWLGSKISPVAVRRPAKPGPYQDAIPNSSMTDGVAAFLATATSVAADVAVGLDEAVLPERTEDGAQAPRPAASTSADVASRWRERRRLLVSTVHAKGADTQHDGKCMCEPRPRRGGQVRTGTTRTLRSLRSRRYRR